MNPGGSGPIQLAMSADRIQESYLKLRYKYSAIILFSSPNFLIRMREREREAVAVNPINQYGVIEGTAPSVSLETASDFYPLPAN